MKIFFRDLVRFNHLGIILRELKLTKYNKLKFIFDPIQKVYVPFYKMHDLIIKIVVSLSEKSTIVKALKQKTFYHHKTHSSNDH